MVHLIAFYMIPLQVFSGNEEIFYTGQQNYLRFPEHVIVALFYLTEFWLAVTS